MNPRTPQRHWRYLSDHDVQVAAVITVLALLLSAGMVWLGYLIHVCRIAVRSPLAPSRRMTVLVFGRRLLGDVPDPDYQQRLSRALALVEQGHADHLLLLGGRSGAQQSEAAAGEHWLRQHGLRGDVRLQLEQDSVDSLENLRHARQLLRTDASLPPVALVTNRYHLARCRMLARRLGFDGLPIAAEAKLPLQPRYLGLLLIEASYLMWIDIGMRWAALTGNTRMTARIR
jgi:vancomycin permeability regulator SanA